MKNFELTIRPAELEDAEKILDLLDEVGGENLYLMLEPGERTLTQIRGLIDQQDTNRSIILLAEGSGDVIGILGFLGGSFKKIAHVIEVGMAIRKEFRGSGIGSILLREAISWARKKGFHRLELGVLSTNQQAISLYKKFGFQEEGVRKSRYRIEEKWVDEILMSKFL